MSVFLDTSAIVAVVDRNDLNHAKADRVRELIRDVVPVLTIRWPGEAQHNSATGAVIAAGRRRLSLVDCTSFEVMKEMGIRRCFAFDPHFREQGFDCLP